MLFSQENSLKMASSTILVIICIVQVQRDWQDVETDQPGEGVYLYNIIIVCPCVCFSYILCMYMRVCGELRMNIINKQQSNHQYT